MTTTPAGARSESPSSFWISLWRPTLGVLAFVSIYTTAMFWVVPGLDEHGYARRGQFGDMYGFLTALFSGVALAAVAIQIHLQRTELANNAQALGGEAAAVRELTLALTAATQASATAVRRRATLEMVDQFATLLLEHPAGVFHDAAHDLNRERANENFLMKVRRTQGLMRMAALSGEIGPDYEQIRTRFLERAQVYFDGTTRGLGSIKDDFARDPQPASRA